MPKPITIASPRPIAADPFGVLLKPLKVETDDGIRSPDSADIQVHRWKVLEGEGGSIQAVAISPDGTLVVAANKRKLMTWGVESGLIAAKIGEFSSTVTDLAFSPNNTHIAVGTEDGLVSYWCVNDWKSRFFRGHSLRVNCVAFSQDGYMLASGSDDGTVNVWDMS